MGIGAIGQSYQAEFRKSDPAGRTGKAAAKPAVSDGSQISEKASQLAKSSADFQTVTTQIAQLSDVRQDKIDEVKQKIASGYYEWADVIDYVAYKLSGTILLP